MAEATPDTLRRMLFLQYPMIMSPGPNAAAGIGFESGVHRPTASGS